MTGSLRILLADDHALVRAGFRALLEALPGFEVVGEAADGYDALRQMSELHPDVALVDISMPGLNGLEMTARACREHPGTRVLVLSMHAEEEYVRQAFVVGAAGYLLKNADKSEFELAVRAVARGDTWLSPGVSKAVVEGYTRGVERGEGPFELLTPRQREILQLVAEGYSSKKIAQQLGLSVKTVDTHRAQLMNRLGMHSIQELVRYAIRVGVLRP
jgi:DNA-binding NarL/FixJ family response regulator